MGPDGTQLIEAAGKSIFSWVGRKVAKIAYDYGLDVHEGVKNASNNYDMSGIASFIPTVDQIESEKNENTGVALCNRQESPKEGVASDIVLGLIGTYLNSKEQKREWQNFDKRFYSFRYKEGCYFIRPDESTWEEYRDSEKCNTYNQFKEDKDAFYIENEFVLLAIGKNIGSPIILFKNKSEWETLYNRLCYTVIRYKKDKEEGYFVHYEDGSWDEFRPQRQKTVWAKSYLHHEDENYYYLDYGDRMIAVSKHEGGDVLSKKHDSDKWWKICTETSPEL